MANVYSTTPKNEGKSRLWYIKNVEENKFRVFLSSNNKPLLKKGVALGSITRMDVSSRDEEGAIKVSNN